MAKIKSLEELKNLRNHVKDLTQLRDTENKRAKVLVSMATCGIAAGAKLTHMAIMEELAARGITDVTVSACGCMGVCYAEPTVEVQMEGMPPILYGRIGADEGRDIVAKHIMQGELLQDHIIEKPF